MLYDHNSLKIKFKPVFEWFNFKQGFQKQIYFVITSESTL
jgi:hypothetical protein